MFKLDLGAKIQILYSVILLPAAEPPRITIHPQKLKDTVPGKPVIFTVQATGTEPLTYQWEHNTGGGSGSWEMCDVERLPGAKSSTLTVPSVQKSNEGSYHCTVSNCAGSETSECAMLTIGELEYVYYTERQELESVTDN